MKASVCSARRNPAEFVPGLPNTDDGAEVPPGFARLCWGLASQGMDPPRNKTELQPTAYVVWAGS